MSRVLFLLLFALSSFAQSPAKDKVWSLEHDYWRYVQAGDMKSYRALWHENFVGWPSSSSAPARKSHITDWYDKDVEKGLKLKSWEIEPLELQETDITHPSKTGQGGAPEIAVVHYRIRYLWVDKDGKGEPATLRIHHTWLCTNGRWQIIAGMSAPTNADGK